MFFRLFCSFLLFFIFSCATTKENISSSKEKFVSCFDLFLNDKNHLNCSAYEEINNVPVIRESVFSFLYDSKSSSNYSQINDKISNGVGILAAFGFGESIDQRVAASEALDDAIANLALDYVSKIQLFFQNSSEGIDDKKMRDSFITVGESIGALTRRGKNYLLKVSLPLSKTIKFASKKEDGIFKHLVLRVCNLNNVNFKQLFSDLKDFEVISEKTYNELLKNEAYIQNQFKSYLYNEETFNESFKSEK